MRVIVTNYKILKFLAFLYIDRSCILFADCFQGQITLFSLDSNVFIDTREFTLPTDNYLTLRRPGNRIYDCYLLETSFFHFVYSTPYTVICDR